MDLGKKNSERNINSNSTNFLYLLIFPSFMNWSKILSVLDLPPLKLFQIILFLTNLPHGLWNS